MINSYNIKRQEGKSSQVVPCYSKNELRSINQDGAHLQNIE